METSKLLTTKNQNNQDHSIKYSNIKDTGLQSKNIAKNVNLNFQLLDKIIKKKLEQEQSSNEHQFMHSMNQTSRNFNLQKVKNFEPHQRTPSLTLTQNQMSYQQQEKSQPYKLLQNQTVKSGSLTFRKPHAVDNANTIMAQEGSKKSFFLSSSSNIHNYKSGIKFGDEKLTTLLNFSNQLDQTSYLQQLMWISSQNQKSSHLQEEKSRMACKRHKVFQNNQILNWNISQQQGSQSLTERANDDSQQQPPQFPIKLPSTSKHVCMQNLKLAKSNLKHLKHHVHQHSQVVDYSLHLKGLFADKLHQYFLSQTPQSSNEKFITDLQQLQNKVSQSNLKHFVADKQIAAIQKDMINAIHQNNSTTNNNSIEYLSGLEKQLHDLKASCASSNHQKMQYRQEAIDLVKYIDFMVSKIENDQITGPFEKCQSVQMVYLLSMNDLVASITSQCFEKGFLIEAIWNSHCSILQRIIVQLNAHNKEQSESFQKKLEKVKQTNQEEINLLQLKNQQQKEEIDTFQDEFSLFLEERQFQEKKLSHQQILLQRLSQHIFEYNVKCASLQLKLNRKRLGEVMLSPDKREFLMQESQLLTQYLKDNDIKGEYLQPAVTKLMKDVLFELSVSQSSQRHGGDSSRSINNKKSILIQRNEMRQQTMKGGMSMQATDKTTTLNQESQTEMMQAFGIGDKKMVRKGTQVELELRQRYQKERGVQVNGPTRQDVSIATNDILKNEQEGLNKQFQHRQNMKMLSIVGFDTTKLQQVVDNSNSNQQEQEVNQQISLPKSISLQHVSQALKKGAFTQESLESKIEQFQKEVASLGLILQQSSLQSNLSEDPASLLSQFLNGSDKFINQIKENEEIMKSNAIKHRIQIAEQAIEIDDLKHKIELFTLQIYQDKGEIDQYIYDSRLLHEQKLNRLQNINLDFTQKQQQQNNQNQQQNIYQDLEKAQKKIRRNIERKKTRHQNVNMEALFKKNQSFEEIEPEIDCKRKNSLQDEISPKENKQILPTAGNQTEEMKNINDDDDSQSSLSSMRSLVENVQQQTDNQQPNWEDEEDKLQNHKQAQTTQQQQFIGQFQQNDFSPIEKFQIRPLQAAKQQQQQIQLTGGFALNKLVQKMAISSLLTVKKITRINPNGIGDPISSPSENMKLTNYKTRLMKNAVLLQSKQSMKMSTVLKVIDCIYQGLLKEYHNHGRLYTNLLDYTYVYFQNIYGGSQQTKIYEQKINAILSNVKYFQLSSSKISLFCKLLVLPKQQIQQQQQQKQKQIEQIEYGIQDVEIYMQSLISLDEPLKQKKKNHLGFALLSNKQAINYVSLSKMQEHLKQLYNQKRTNYSMVMSIDSLLSKIKAKKVPDPMNRNQFLVDFDFAIDEFLMLRIQSYNILIPLLHAVDIKGKGFLGLKKLRILLSTFEGCNFKSDHQYSILLHQSADHLLQQGTSTQKLISYRAFVELCEKRGLLQEQKIRQFLINDIKNVSDIKPDEYPQIRNIQDLQVQWAQKKDLIKLKLISAKMFSSLYSKMFKLIDEYCDSVLQLNAMKSQTTNIQSPSEKERLRLNEYIDKNQDLTWIRYKIIESQAAYFTIEKILNQVMPVELLDVESAFYQQTLKKYL